MMSTALRRVTVLARQLTSAPFMEEAVPLVPAATMILAAPCESNQYKIVFPGGAVEATDSEISASLVGDSRLSNQIACLRETFEETGVLPFEASPAVLAQRHSVHADASAFKKVLNNLSSLSVASALVSMVHWTTFVTPLFERKRFDTPFYLLVLSEADAAAVMRSAAKDDKEATDVDWLTPLECITRFNDGIAALPPPQNGPAGKVITLALPGDCEHPETGSGQDAAQHRLVWSPKAAGAAKYVYTRSAA